MKDYKYIFFFITRIELSNQAKELRLLTNIVCDAGRTEVNVGTKTVLAIGPGMFTIYLSIWKSSQKIAGEIFLYTFLISHG